MKIALGSDHAGFDLKESIKRHLESGGNEVEDFGTFDSQSTDYPDYAFKVAKAVASGKAKYGVLVCSTGVGMAIAANKVSGIRAALATSVDVAAQSRAHLDANVLVFGQKVTDESVALAALDKWLATPFEGGRHERRLKKIIEFEKAR